MKNIKNYFCIALFCCIGMISCQKEDDLFEAEDQIQERVDTGLKVSKETIEKIKALSLNPEGMEVIYLEDLNGNENEVYLIEGDIVISPGQLETLSQDDITSKQYRTTNLVNNNRTIKILGINGGSQALTSKQRTALQNAVADYNSLDIGLSFTLTFGTNTTSQDIVVRQLQGAAGGVAGFPSNGNPYNSIVVYSGLESYSNAVNEHVMKHEIGHTLGLRHTDWFSRQSCGGSGESSAPYGAVHIPGTPTGYDSSSLMLACFNSYESGNFGSYDIVALEYLYPLPSFSVNISGPTRGNNSGTYTWNANVQNGNGPYTYSWYYSYTGTSYTQSFGSTQSVTANLPLDRDLYLKVIVTSSSGTDSDTFFTMNTDAF